MGKDSISYEDLIQIVQLIESSSRFSEFHLKIGDVEIDLRAKIDGEVVRGSHAEAAPPPAAESGERPANAISRPSAASSSARAELFAEGLVLVRSPMVGTFYRAPEPGAEPFVTVGSRVKPDTTVCIIEVMKLMSSLAAEHDGVVKQILVDNGELVDAAQVLMVIDPKA